MSPNQLFVLTGLLALAVWIPLVMQLSGDARVVIPSILLGVAAFAPDAVGVIGGGSREGLAAAVAPRMQPDATLSWALSGLYLVIVGCLVVTKRRLRAWRTPLDKVMLALVLGYWLIGAISNYVNSVPAPRVSFYLVPLIAAAAYAFRPTYDLAIKILAIGCTVVCGVGLFVAAFRPGVAYTEPTRFTSFLFSNRLAGITEHPNALALTAAIGFVTGLRLPGVSRWICLAFCSLALIGADSRTGWFGLGAAACVLLAGASKGNVKARRNLAPRLLLACGLSVIVAFVISSYLGQIQGNSFHGRGPIWRFVLDNWSSSLWIGHGPGAWAKLIEAGKVPVYVGQAHGQFFETLYTLGAAGIVVLTAILVVWSIRSYRFAAYGEWTPLALQALVIAYGTLESPLNLWGVGSDLWLLAMILFLESPELEPGRAWSTRTAGPPEGFQKSYSFG